MPDDKKKGGGAGGAGDGGSKDAKADRRRLNYLKMRAKEIKHELQSNKKESDALREKLGMGPKTKKGSAGGDDE